MVRKKSKHDATPSMLGFLYQCRFALLLALRRYDPDVLISVEKLDDIAFVKDFAAGQHLPLDLRQLKHHLSRQGGLGDKSRDIWKTLRIWAEAVKAKEVDLDCALLFMVTTSTATEHNAVYQLSSQRDDRDPEKARETLEKAGAESTAKKVQEAHSALMKLSKRKRQQLFRSIQLIDGSHDIKQLRSDIENEIRLVTTPQHRETFTDLLEGWWFRVVIDHLMDSTSRGIFVRQVVDQVGEIREQFKRDNLPDEFLDAEVPDSKKKEDDPRTFVKQLNLIEVSDKRVRHAQEDHFKAYEQRSKWVRKDLLGIGELQKLERRLTEEWRRRFDIMLEGTDEDDSSDDLVRYGKAIYEWVELHAPNNPFLFVRPEFRSSYMTRGSYHMLADQLRVGWHRRYDELLAGEWEDNGDAC